MKDDLFELQGSAEYSSYIIAHGDRPVGNGDMLLELMEEGYMFEEFLASIGM